MVSDTNVGTSEAAASRRAQMGIAGASDVRVAYVKPISWAGVFAGVSMAAVTHLMLMTLGIGIGMATVDPYVESDPTRGLTTGAAIWSVVSMLLSLGVGGFTAGYIAGSWRFANGVLHGLMVWAVSAVLSLLLITSSAVALVGGGLAALGRNGQISFNQGAVGVNTGGAGLTLNGEPGSREFNADTGRTTAQTNGTVTEPEARAAADRAANAASKAGFWAFAGLLLGAAAAGAGGRMGRDRAPTVPADPLPA